MDFTKNGRFVYADSGAGPLVVLFHGFPDLPTGYADMQAALNEAGYRTVIPYLRGYHADTIVAGRGYGRAEIAADAIELLDALGADDAVIVGHDWGAAVTYGAAELAPDRVRALCTLAIPHPAEIKPSPALLWKARHFITLRVPTGTWLARRDDFAHIDVLMRRWAPRWTGPARDATLREIKAAFVDPRVLDGALQYYRDSTPAKLGKLRPPALLVGGTTDLLEQALWHASKAHFEGRCDVVIVDGAGHWPHREGADQVHAALLEFLGSLT